jgi:hypothetical protein
LLLQVPSPGLASGPAEAQAAELRADFYLYRCQVRPNMLQNWWPMEIADALQQFYQDLIAGKRPRLAIGAPPQHGKSLAAEDFIPRSKGRAEASSKLTRDRTARFSKDAGMLIIMTRWHVDDLLGRCSGCGARLWRG